jgi:hypothetical protein
VRKANLYGVGRSERNVTHYQMKVEDNILTRCSSWSRPRLPERREAIAKWNAQSSPVIKRGIAITPVKFGISFTATFFNQAGALVHVYTDGSVQVNHGGTEMGQGLHTKVCADRGRRTGRAVRAGAHHRHRHQQGPQRLGHRGIQRHRPERPRRAVRGAQRARQPGAVRRRPGRLRRRRR